MSKILPIFKFTAFVCVLLVLSIGSSFSAFALYNNGEDGTNYDNRDATTPGGADLDSQSFTGTNYVGYRNTRVPNSTIQNSVLSGTNNVHGGSDMNTTVTGTEFKGSGGANIDYTDWNGSVTILDSNTYNQQVTIDADATGQTADAVLEIANSDFNSSVTLNADGSRATSSSGYVELSGNSFNGAFNLNSDNVNLSIGSTQETATIISELQTSNDYWEELLDNQYTGLPSIASTINYNGAMIDTTITRNSTAISTTITNVAQAINNNILNAVIPAINALHTDFNTFWAKYNPDGTGWQYFDAENEQPANSGLKGVFYKITEYTGKTYEWLTREDENLEDSADSLDNTLSSLETSEQVVTQSVSTDLATFNPNLSAISNLAAIGWVGNLLQNIFLALGSFQIPIMVSLFLGVGMQFIGYYRYK